MPDLDNISDRNLAAILWAVGQEEEFADFANLSEVYQEFWIGQVQQFRSMLGVVMRPTAVLPFPPQKPIAVTTYPEGFRP
jgi:hypothetical protein